MKKIKLIALCLVTTSAFAQKANQGNFTSEIGVSLASSGTTINSFGLNGRYFLLSRLALVGGVSGAYNKSTDDFMQNTDGTGTKGSFTNVSYNFEVALGVQKHFKGTNRISPFVGADVFNNFTGAKKTGNNANSLRFMDDYTYSEESKSQRIGLRAAIGFDYWIAQGLYFGVIYQPISVNLTTEKDTKLTTVQQGVSKTTITPGSKSLNLNTTGRIGSIRLGWLF